MIRQKPISARVDLEILHQLEQEAFASGYTKNRILNEALALYIWMQDLRRAYVAMGRQGTLLHLLKEHRTSTPTGARWLLWEFCDK